MIADKTYTLSNLEFQLINHVLDKYLKKIAFFGIGNSHRYILDLLKFGNQKIRHETLEDLIAAEVQEDCDISEKQLKISAIELAIENINECFKKLVEFDSTKEEIISDAIATINDVFMMMIKYFTKSNDFEVIKAIFEKTEVFPILAAIAESRSTSRSFDDQSIPFEASSVVDKELVNEVVQTGALKKINNDNYDYVQEVISIIKYTLIIVLKYVVKDCNIEVVNFLVQLQNLSAILRNLCIRIKNNSSKSNQKSLRQLES